MRCANLLNAMAMLLIAMVALVPAVPAVDACAQRRERRVQIGRGEQRFGLEWDARHRFYSKVIGEVKEETDLMFFGDSITESMATASSALEIYREEYVTGVFGIGGDTTENLLWRLQNNEFPKDWKPKAVVIMIGINDIRGTLLGGLVSMVRPEMVPVTKKDVIEEIVSNIEQIVSYIQQQSCKTQVIVQALLPSADPTHRHIQNKWPNRMTSWINDVNKGIKKLAEENSGVHMADCTNIFLEKPRDGPMRMNAPLMTDLLQPSEFGQELLAFCLMPKIQSILQESARESNDVVSLGMTSSPIEDIVMYNNSSDSGTMETLTWLRGDNVTLPANMTMPPPLPLEDETAARQDVWDQPTISKGLEQDPFTVQHWTQISAVVNAGKNIPSRPILSAPGAAEENVRCAEKPYLIFTKETLDRFSTYNYVACNTLCELDGQCRATVFNKEEESAHQQCRLYRNCFPVKSTSKDKTSYKFGPSLKKTYPVDGYCSLSKICQGPLPTNPADGLCNLGAKNCESCGGKYCVI